MQTQWHIEKSTGHEIGFRAIVDGMALPYVEDHEGSDIYKPQAVTAALAIIRAAIHKATDQTA